MKYRLLLLIALLLTACGRRGEEIQGPSEAPAAETEATAVPIPTRSAEAGTTILADGQIVAVNPVLQLAFTTGGRLLTIQVQAGDKVIAGDLIATLDDAALRDAVAAANLAVSQAENSLAQAQLTLDDLLDWEPDELAVALAEANLAAAEANLERAQTQDAAAGNSLTAAQISLNQAERALADAQEAYDTAWQPARDWELNDPFRGPALEAEREGTERAVQGAEEALQVARANYSLALASLNSDNAINADAALVSAQQALENARTGPRESEIAAAQLGVVQAELSLEQASFNLDQAEAALDDARLTAPWTGTVLSVDAAAGGLVSAGTPIVTLLDTEHLQFHTANLSERDLTYVAPGLPAAITLKALPDRQLDGTVAYIVPKASGSVGDAATFTVAIELDTSPGSTEALLAGMTGRVEIQRPSDF